MKSKPSTPFGYHVQDDIRFMNSTIIHNDDGVRAWKGVHSIEESVNKPCEFCCSEWALYDINHKNPIQRESGENRISIEPIFRILQAHYKVYYSPTTVNKKGLPCGTPPLQCPCSSTIWDLAVTWTLINSHQLVRGIIPPNLCHIGCSFCCTSFYGRFC